MINSAIAVLLQRGPMIDGGQGALGPTSGSDELGERVAAALRRGRHDRDPLDAELAEGRIRASMLDERRTPVQLGRYVVLQRIGSGGMGVVYAAYDPELDRKVALKEFVDRRTVPCGRRRSRRSHPRV